MTPEPGCPRHRQLCAYTGSEPDRCPVCHSTWARVGSCGCDRCGNSRAHHLAAHQRKDEAEARKAARKSAPMSASGGDAARADALLARMREEER